MAMKTVNKISQNEKLRKALKRRGVSFDFVAKKLKQNASHENVFGSNKALDMIITVMDARPPQRVDVSKHQVTEINITLKKAEKIQELTGEQIIDAEILPD